MFQGLISADDCRAVQDDPGNDLRHQSSNRNGIPAITASDRFDRGWQTAGFAARSGQAIAHLPCCTHAGRRKVPWPWPGLSHTRNKRRHRGNPGQKVFPISCYPAALEASAPASRLAVTQWKMKPPIPPAIPCASSPVISRVGAIPDTPSAALAST